MKTININLLGERPSSKLSLAPDLSIDFPAILPGVLSIAVALVIPGLIGFGIDSLLINPANATIEQIKQSIGANRGKASQLAEVQRQAESLEGDYNTLLTLAKQSATWKIVLEEVRDLTPTDMWLTQLTIDNGTRLKLSGVALDYRSIAFFYTNLQNATNFSHPVLGGLDSSEMTGQPVIKFTVDCDIHEGIGG